MKGLPREAVCRRRPVTPPAGPDSEGPFFRFLHVQTDIVGADEFC